MLDIEFKEAKFEIVKCSIILKIEMVKERDDERKKFLFDKYEEVILKKKELEDKHEQYCDYLYDWYESANKFKSLLRTWKI